MIKRLRLSAPVIVLVFCILGFLVRTYKITNPIADWHSWRQADTSAVSKRFVEEGFDLLHPKYFDISKIQSGLENPQGYRFVEFPVYNILQAGLFKTLPFWGLEIWGRLITAITYVVSSIFFYLFVAKHFGRKVGILTLFYYLFMPYAIYYSRTILPDPFMISLVVMGFYSFDKYIDGKNQVLWFIFSAIFIALSLLAKPFAGFYMPVFIALIYSKIKLALFKRVDLYILGIVSVVPLMLWRIWISQFPEGIPLSAWLLNGGNIRFKGAFFYWIFGERIGKLMLGYFGSSLMIMGLLFQSKKNLLTYSFVIASLLYITIIARGNVQHDYYQILLIPTISLLLGRGAVFLIENQKKNAGLIFVGIITVFSFAFSWYYVRDYFNINNIALVHAGQRADLLLPKNAKVIAPFEGDTTLLYYINRLGWPVVDRSIDDLKKLGATNMVIVNPTVNDFEGYGKIYRIIDSSKEYLILDLQ